MNQEQNLPKDTPIDTWRQFTAQIRSKEHGLLKTLDTFPDAVLVTGCQRSGTTMLARIITQSEGMVNYWVGPDDELDAALILCGHTPAPSPGRYCFQTTYVDEYYREYYQHQGDYKMIWVLRNPYSVVTSLLYNWAPRSLDGTFSRYADERLSGMSAMLYRLIGVKAISRTRRACEVYKAKTLQLFELFAAFGPEKILIVDYDELVLHKETALPKVYGFIDLAYDPVYHQQIHRKSVAKKSRLNKKESMIIQRIAEPVYEKALKLKLNNQ